MPKPAANDVSLMALLRAISVHNTQVALQFLADAPELARASLTQDAQFDWPKASYIGDTALHIAAAVYALEVVDRLIALSADVRARNRRGAEALHYAAVGSPGSVIWNPEAQAATIERLIKAGADPNATDKNGVMPLHRAVRTRSAAAVKALLGQGADVRAKNGNGSTPLLLANHNTGHGGTGSDEAKAQQYEIVRLLEAQIAAG
jgi:ankyrin repeat protein